MNLGKRSNGPFLCPTGIVFVASKFTFGGVIEKGEGAVGE